MKKTDLAMIILIASLSVLFAYLIVGAIPILKPSDKQVMVKTIVEYKSDISEPNKEIFNRDAINPTIDVMAGGSSDSE